jgi:hypothetical protein
MSLTHNQSNEYHGFSKEKAVIYEVYLSKQKWYAWQDFKKI